MKVAILSRHFSRLAGGAESYAVQLAEAMRSECEITVISQSFDALPGHFANRLFPGFSRSNNLSQQRIKVRIDFLSVV